MLGELHINVYSANSRITIYGNSTSHTCVYTVAMSWFHPEPTNSFETQYL